MVLIVALILSLYVPAPWNLGVIVVGVFAEIGEIIWGRRLAKRWRPKTGPEAMIGQTAAVVAACRPQGQVRLNGELWEARCAAGADVGDDVSVTALDRLTLVVVPKA